MSRLFQPLTVGPTRLEHRVAMAPLTRYRMDDDYTATPLSKGTTITTPALSDEPLLTCLLRIL